jgi:threonine synthase
LLLKVTRVKLPQLYSTAYTVTRKKIAKLEEAHPGVPMTLRLNPRMKDIRCSLTGQSMADLKFSKAPGLCQCCPAPGRPLTIHYDLRGEAEAGVYSDESQRGIWRYAPLLPVHGVPSDYACDVGQSPTMKHLRLSEALDCELFVKQESTNPSGSFKDRGLSVAIALGLAFGARRFCLPTQGNAGVAASFFSARLGLPPALVYMPEGHRGSIYHKAAETFGAEICFHGANIAAAGQKMRGDLRGPLSSGELVDLSTFFEPGRLEGKKTMGLEIFDFFGGAALPATIVYPTGGGTGLVGIWKAFMELRELGCLSDNQTLPKMIAVQSNQCAPVVEAFDRGDAQVTPITSKGTMADGLDVPGAIMGHKILDCLYQSKGRAVSVSEDAITESFQIAGRSGLSVSYEGAAVLRAIQQLRDTDYIKSGEEVLALITAGHQVALSGAS